MPLTKSEKVLTLNKEEEQKYMQMAIDEMKKSIVELRDDGKIPPKVGAVLVFPGGRVVKAHRGELRDGDHAEFTLIERKLGSEKLDHCILFTTLEPCVERNNPKIACCKRTSKARIRSVYVGISDPDHTVDGKGIQHLEDNHIKVTMFNREFQKIIEVENEEFRKQANERKKERKKEVIKLTKLEKIITGTSKSNLDPAALDKFIEESGLDFNSTNSDFTEYLLEMGVLKRKDENDEEEN